jgi:type IV secretory pathway VirB2 component (pilin)
MKAMVRSIGHHLRTPSLTLQRATLSLSMALLPAIARAQTVTGGASPQTMINNVCTFILGPFGETIAVLGIIGIGFLFMFGRASLGVIAGVIGGIGQSHGGRKSVAWLQYLLPRNRPPTDPQSGDHAGCAERRTICRQSICAAAEMWSRYLFSPEGDGRAGRGQSFLQETRGVIGQVSAVATLAFNEARQLYRYPPCRRSH